MTKQEFIEKYSGSRICCFICIENYLSSSSSKQEFLVCEICKELKLSFIKDDFDPTQEAVLIGGREPNLSLKCENFSSEVFILEYKEMMTEEEELKFVQEAQEKTKFHIVYIQSNNTTKTTLLEIKSNSPECSDISESDYNNIINKMKMKMHIEFVIIEIVNIIKLVKDKKI